MIPGRERERGKKKIEIGERKIKKKKKGHKLVFGYCVENTLKAETRSFLKNEKQREEKC